MLRGGVTAALVGALSGCLIVPETSKHEIRSYVHESQDKPSQAVPVVVARPDGPQLWVDAEWRRTCTVWFSEITEYRVETSATLADLDMSCSGDGCAYGLIAILALAPLTLTVSGLITGVIVSNSDDEIRREVKSQNPSTRACDAPGNGFHVRASVRGQPDVAAVTDAEGRARILLPPTTAASAAQPIVLHTDIPKGVAPIVIRRGPPGSQR